jgi:ABC-type branched-subunit amino acid transport system substrate-binding protein
MKKGYWVALGLVLVLVLGVFAAACGSSTTTTTAATTATTSAPATSETTAPASTETTGGSSSTTAAANTTPLKFGIAISLTGDSAAPCEQIKEAFDEMAKMVNANGGIAGRQVQLIYADDQSKMDTAVAAVQSLVDQKVDVVFGPFPQWTQAPTRPVTNKAGILQIAFGPPTLQELNTDQSTAEWTYYFFPATGPDGTSDAFLREMVNGGYKNVLGIGDQMVISQETLKVLGKSMPASNIQFTLMSDSWGLGETDLTPIANKIAAKIKEVKPDALILASNPVHVNQIEKLLHQQGVKIPIYNQASGAHPLVMLAPAGNDPANVAGDYAFGPAIVDPSQIPDSYPAKADLVAFINAWKADYPKEAFASLFLGFGYDAFGLAQQAISTATEQTEAGWAAAMTKVDWVGAQGEYKFSASDHVGDHGGFFQWQYTNGQGFKYVGDLNAMSDPVLLPATSDAVASFK